MPLRPRHLLVPLLTAAAVAAAPASAAVSVSTSPSLYPRFKRSFHDYVSRCVSGQRLRVSVDATDGDRVAVGSRAPRGGSFHVDLDRHSGQAATLRVEPAGGRSSSYRVRCLPRDFPHWKTYRNGKPQAQWYLLAPVGQATTGYAAIFDAHGVPVWWRHSSRYAPWAFTLLRDGHLAWARQFGEHFGERPDDAWEEHRLDGSRVRTIKAVGGPTDIHELQQLPNGHYLVDVYRKRRHANLSRWGGPKDATVYDGEIQELTRKGRLVWRWNSRDHVSPGEMGRWLQYQVEQHATFDLFHLNSIEPDGDGLIVSARHVDALYRIDRSTGRIDWKLGGTHTSKSLTVFGTPAGQMPLAGQHDARLRPDGTITVYDNNSATSYPPRDVRFAVDPAARTATLVEQVQGDPTWRSGSMGSARKLPGGDWVTSWGGYPVVSEEAPGGRTVLRLIFADDDYTYRAVPVPPGTLSPRAIRRGMNRMSR